MSMVLLLTYANHFDIEGLVATPIGSKPELNPSMIHRIVQAYGKVQKNLEKHEAGFPSAASLKKVIAKGVAFNNPK